MGHHGPHFTWVNKQGGTRHIQERLDGVAINGGWKAPFPKVNLEKISIHGSDHSCLVLDTSPYFSFILRPFIFKWAWTSHPNCRKHIQTVWQSKSKSNPNCFLNFKNRLDVLPLPSHLLKDEIN